MRKFRQLFTLTVTHQYYGGEGDPNLLIQPTASTEQLIRQYNFQINTTTSTLSFYTSQSNIAHNLDYLTTISEQDYFEFELIPSTENFYNYTDVPIDFNGCFFYESTTKTSETDSVQLSVVGKEPGDQKVYATVKIHFSNLKATAKETPINYRINLLARTTVWNYYIINRSGLNLDQARVEDKKESIIFQREAETKLENGQSAIPFKMQGEAIPMSTKTKYQFNLVNQQKGSTSLTNKSTKEKVIFKGLPAPAPQWIQNKRKNGKSYISSPIYVYV